MTTITFECGWCRSKNQTADLIHTTFVNQQSFGREHKLPYIVVICRRCDRASSLICGYQSPLPAHLEKYKTSYGSGVGIEIFKHNGDISFALDFKSQNPSLRHSLSDAIPEIVRENCLDAEEARSPRAKCQSYRAAVEFALREANIANTPGKPLGGLLLEASKSFAISSSLIALCDQIKAFGNWGMHWSETEILKSDSDAAKSITYAILDYLFVLPAQVAEAKSRTDAAQMKHKNPNAEDKSS